MLKTSNALDTILFKSFFFLRKKQTDVTILKIKQLTISRKPTDTIKTLDKE